MQTIGSTVFRYDATGEELEIEVEVSGSWSRGEPDVGIGPGFDDFAVLVDGKEFPVTPDEERWLMAELAERESTADADPDQEYSDESFHWRSHGPGSGS